jgi:glycosyltransferase involved in cell wall biosynthesis
MRAVDVLPRALQIIPSVTPKNGGPSEAIVRIVSALRAVSVDTCVLTTDYHGRRERLPTDERSKLIRRLGSVYFAQTWWNAYTFAPGMAWWLLRQGGEFDLVHLHALFSFSTTLGAVYSILRRKRFIVRPLGTLAPYGLRARRAFAKRISLALIEKPILTRASAVHCTSEAERQDVLAVCPKANAVVIPLSVETPSFVDAEIESTVEPLEMRPPRVLYLSRLDPKKNVEVLLDAFAMLVRRVPIAELIVAGDGDARYVDSLRVRADQLGISHRIQWLGHVTGEVKASAFRTAYVFVLPSQSENFGIAVAEALAAGVPCVVSPQVAIAPEIERYGAGIVVNAEQNVLADALTSFLEQPTRRAACALAARKLARDEYSDAKLGERLLSLYQDLLAKEAQDLER